MGKFWLSLVGTFVIEILILPGYFHFLLGATLSWRSRKKNFVIFWKEFRQRDFEFIFFIFWLRVTFVHVGVALTDDVAATD